MTFLHDPRFITFRGTPETGRVPPRLRVMNSAPMTSSQQEGIAAHYKAFRDALAVSVGGYRVHNRTLKDGTRVRMESINGVDTVLVWPPTSGIETAAGSFWGVPASFEHPDGIWFEGYRPSWRWYGYLTSPPPETLIPEGAALNHPGHITWSSKKFTREGRRVQLSWRGPGSRYSESSGWSGSDGGIPIAHGGEWAPGPIVSRTDSSIVWIDGVEVYTGIEKVVAAALFRPDPEKSPEHVILRVCSNNYPQLSAVRALAVFDLSPQGLGNGGSTLEALVSGTDSYANRLVTTAEYPAPNYKSSLPPGANVGEWHELQRPHFDSSGERLITIANVKVDATSPDRRCMSFDIPSWTGTRHGSEVSTQINTSDTTGLTYFESIPVENGSITNIATEALRETSGTIDMLGWVAADFLEVDDPNDPDAPDEVVHVTARRRRTTGTTSQTTSNWGYSGGSENYTEAMNLTVSHSKYGTLLKYDRPRTISRTLSTSAGSGSGSGTASEVLNSEFTFLGDLSRDVFAVGGSNAVISPAYTASGSTFWAAPDTGIATGSSHTLIVEGPPMTRANPRMMYDVYISGVKVAEEVPGGHVSTDPPEGREVEGSFSLYVIAHDYGHSFNDGYSPGDPLPVFEPAHTVTSYRLEGGTDPAGVGLKHTYFSHMAVDPSRKVVYFGEGLNHTSLSIVVRDVTGGDAVEVMPFYAEGQNSSVYAPIFLPPRPP